MAKNILFIVGSLRQNSFNAQLAKQAEEVLANRGNVSYLEYADIPLLNQDIEEPVLPAVARVREAVQQADALWIFSPAYNHAIPGVMKNLIDWLSRALDLSDLRGESAIHNKVVTVSSVANGISVTHCLDDYRRLLPIVRTQMVEPMTGMGVNPEAWATGKLDISADKVAELKQQADALLAALD